MGQQEKIMKDEKVQWMNLPEEYITSDSKFIIIPIEYEKDVTFGVGASKGSREIIKASKHLEYYDDQFDTEPFLEGIRMIKPLQLSDKDPQEMVETIATSVQKELEVGNQDDSNKFIIGLGGDHAVTIGMVKGLEQKYGDFSVIQFDAHADFRDSWNDSSLNHACVARQISKRHDVLLLGIRSMDVDEKELIEKSKNVHLVKMYDYSLDKLKEILPKLHRNVYVTIDVDAYDPSFIRNTGTPEPGGFLWHPVIDALKLIFKEKTVIGADIVEFSPVNQFEGEAYALSKLIYKIMALATLDKENL